MQTILHLAVLTITVLDLSRLLPSVHVANFRAALIVAIVFSVLNFFLGWFIRAMLFVPAILTLGLLFLFVPFLVNTALLWLTDKLVASFEIASFKALLISAVVITLVNSVFYAPAFREAWLGNPSHPSGLDGVGQPRWI